jgi:hypothetical protein
MNMTRSSTMHRFTCAGKGLGAVIGIVLGAALTVSPAAAASITFNFAGTVDSVHGQLDPPFEEDQTMSGQATVESVGSGGVYTIQDFNVDIGGYNATMGTSGEVIITDNDSGKDQFLLLVHQPNGDEVGDPILLSPSLFGFLLRGEDTIFANEALPTTPPDLSSFDDENVWRLIFEPGDGRHVEGRLTSFTSLTVVPLPPAVILFGAGLVALIGLGAGRWRLDPERLRLRSRLSGEVGV